MLPKLSSHPDRNPGARALALQYLVSRLSTLFDFQRHPHAKLLAFSPVVLSIHMLFYTRKIRFFKVSFLCFERKVALFGLLNYISEWIP